MWWRATEKRGNHLDEGEEEETLLWSGTHLVYLYIESKREKLWKSRRRNDGTRREGRCGYTFSPWEKSPAEREREERRWIKKGNRERWVGGLELEATEFLPLRGKVLSLTRLPPSGHFTVLFLRTNWAKIHRASRGWKRVINNKLL